MHRGRQESLAQCAHRLRPARTLRSQPLWHCRVTLTRAHPRPYAPAPHAPGVRLPAAAQSAQCRGSRQESSARSGAMWPRGNAGRAGAGAPRSGLRTRLGRALGCWSADRPASAAASSLVASRPPAPGPQHGAAAWTAGSGRPRLPAGERGSQRAIAPGANCRPVLPRREAPGRAGAGEGAAGRSGGGHSAGRGRAPVGWGALRSGAGRGAGECRSVRPRRIGSATRSHSCGSERAGRGSRQPPGLSRSGSP